MPVPFVCDHWSAVVVGRISLAHEKRDQIISVCNPARLTLFQGSHDQGGPTGANLEVTPPVPILGA